MKGASFRDQDSGCSLIELHIVILSVIIVVLFVIVPLSAYIPETDSKPTQKSVSFVSLIIIIISFFHLFRHKL